MSAKSFRKDQRPYSSVVVDGVERTPSRAMLRAVGFTDADFKKPQIGIASTWSKVTPCNMHIDRLAAETEKGIGVAGGKAVMFNTITISDGISMGTEGMKYSLVSREVIADSIEAVSACEGFDGVVALGGCDKNMPGCLIALARLDRPSVFVYGGSIKPGCYCGKDVDIVSVFEAVGQHAKGEITSKELAGIERTAIPGEGSCGGMYTANTMASAIEALGMSLPNSSSRVAVSREKAEEAHAAGRAVMHLIEKGIRPSDILTRPAFLNAITVVMALGGSTNAVLHLLAMAKSARVRLRLSDFTAVGKKVPVLADLKPSGKYVMADLANIGGVAPLMARLLKEGLLDGDCMTVTGKTLKQNLALIKPYPRKQDVIRPFNRPVKKQGNLVILKGNLAPDGAVAKISGKEGLVFEGKAVVFNSEEQALKKILDGSVKAGHVVVIRYEGPQGGPGMREMLAPTSAIMGRGLGKEVALITDGRFSGGSHGFVIGHITPEAYTGGPLALVKNGDVISINATVRSIELKVAKSELERRSKAWKKPRPKHKHGVLAKYARLVGPASEGAVTD
ncbi:dihydroxy-acid dehydratase [Pontiellaceae bacterium B12227]|nr:dihydroxy-acid dehydratase [Pontiellaceae bacterium B12227]